MHLGSNQETGFLPCPTCATKVSPKLYSKNILLLPQRDCGAVANPTLDLKCYMSYSAQHLQIYNTRGIKAAQLEGRVSPEPITPEWNTQTCSNSTFAFTSLPHQPSIMLRVFIWAPSLTLKASYNKSSEKFLLKARLCRKAAGSNLLNNCDELKGRDPVKDTTQSS